MVGTTTAGATVAAMAVMTTERRRRGGGPDRISVVLFSITAFLGVLALLVSQLHVAPATRPKLVEVRRVYRTTVIETVLGSRAAATVVSSSTSGAASTPPATAPTTRVS